MTEPNPCAICAEHAHPDRWVCSACTARLDALLAGIGDLHARLDAAPRGGATASRGAPGFASSPPASLDVLLLTDPRTRATREDRFVAATVNVLTGWGVRAGDVPGLVAGLRSALPRIASRPWVEDLHRVLQEHHRDLLRVHGELEPSVSVGPCPLLVITDDDDGDDEVGRVCRGRIRAQAWGTVATCPRCGTVWRGVAAWRDLGRTLGPVYLDAPELARYFGHDSPSTVRTWASRDRWPRRRRNGRTVYRLDAALATWARLNAPPELSTAPDPGVGAATS